MRTTQAASQPSVICDFKPLLGARSAASAKFYNESSKNLQRRLQMLHMHLLSFGVREARSGIENASSA
jgi:hypothetical protein